MIPCLKELSGLSILASTADQRALLGEDTFLRTHTPMSFQRYRVGSTPVLWSESDLLGKLIDCRGVPRGNRIFLLYGAAGSGKSETLRWLQAKMTLEHPDRARAVVRIPRTALDPVRITDAVLRHFGESGLDAQLDRWESLKQKPVALANQVIWGALGDLLSRDHDIIPLSYKLRPVIEENLRKGIASIDQEGPGAPLELLTREQLREAMTASSLISDLPYETFLARLREEFDQAVLGDVRLASALRALSQMAVEKWGTRPVLLIDDLVQSLNVYASDLLDYFLTLEEGDWDVVVGLTPASFEGTERTRELLQRINHLDTVDDRVTRLYLSDVRGDDSSFLTIDSVEPFLENYLVEVKRAHGFQCDATCAGHATCHALQMGQTEHTRLAPFNPALLKRVFAGLPRSKGKPRYLLAATRDLLESAHIGMDAWLEALRQRMERNHYAETGDLQLKTFAEAYVAEQNSPGAVMTLPGNIGLLVTGRSEPTSVVVHPLSSSPNGGALAVGSSVSAPVRHANSDSATVRDWLEGRSVNKELLKPLRTGVGRWVKDTVDPTRMSGLGSLKPAGVLRWSVQSEDSEVPVSLEGVDSDDGVVVPRSMGVVAFDFLRYGEALGRGKETVVDKLLENPVSYGLVLAAERWQRAKMAELQDALGMPLDDFAQHLGTVMLSLPELDTPWERHAVPPLPTAGRGFLAGITFGRRETQLAAALWEDMFRVRDNVHRAAQLQSLRRFTQDQSLEALLRIDLQGVHPGFRIGPMRLREYLQAITPRLVALSRLNEHAGIREHLNQYVAMVRLNDQLTSAETKADLRRRVYLFLKLVGQLPAPLRQQLPDLSIPTDGGDFGADELLEMAQLAAHHPHEVPPLTTYRLVSQVMAALDSPRGVVVRAWAENLETAVRAISGWSDGFAQTDRDADVQSTLRWLTAAVRSYLSASQRGSSAPDGDLERWSSRLRALEVLLPPRSALRKRFGDELRTVNERSSCCNWAKLEHVMGRVVQSWRNILVVAQLLPVQQHVDGLGDFLDEVTNGEETDDSLARWEHRLAAAIRALRVQQLRGREFSSFLTTLSSGEAHVSLGELSAPALQELRLYLPQVFRRLRVSVG